MKTLSILLLLMFCTAAFAAEYPLLAQAQQPTKPIDVKTAPPRMMGLYEQGFDEGVKVGNEKAGKIGWFFAGFGNLPFLWLPWVVEPPRPAKPSILAEEEYNSGYKGGYRDGWKNAHKRYYIAGTIVESAIVGAIVIANNK